VFPAAFSGLGKEFVALLEEGGKAFVTETYITSFGLPVVVSESVQLDLVMRGRPSPPPPASPPPPSVPPFPFFPPPGNPPSPPLPPPLSPPNPESPPAPVPPPPLSPGAPGRPPPPRGSSPPPPVVPEIVFDAGSQGVTVQDKLPPVIVLNGLSTVTVQIFQSYTDRGEAFFLNDYPSPWLEHLFVPREPDHRGAALLTLVTSLRGCY